MSRSSEGVATERQASAGARDGVKGKRSDLAARAPLHALVGRRQSETRGLAIHELVVEIAIGHKVVLDLTTDEMDLAMSAGDVEAQDRKAIVIRVMAPIVGDLRDLKDHIARQSNGRGPACEVEREAIPRDRAPLRLTTANVTHWRFQEWLDPVVRSLLFGRHV